LKTSSNTSEKIAAEISEKKPIIILKGGKTKSGARSASSHTGSIAGSYAIFKSFCKQAGIIEAEDSSDLIDLARAAKIFHPNKFPRGNRVTIFTGGGGAGVILSDILENHGLQLAKLEKETIEKLSEILPPHWPHGNPVDSVGSMEVWMQLKKIMKIISQDNNTDIIMTSIPTMGAAQDDIPEPMKKWAKRVMGIEEINRDVLVSFDRNIAKDIIRILRKTDKLLVFPTSHYNSEGHYEYEIFTKLFENGVLVVSNAVDGSRIIKKMLAYKEFLKKRRNK